MGIDASIPLSVQPFQAPDPMKAAQNAYGMKQMADQYKQQQTDARDNTIMSSVLKNIDPNDPNYDDKATKALWEAGVTPTKVLEFKKTQLDAQSKKSEIDLRKAQTKEAIDKDVDQHNEHSIKMLGETMHVISNTTGDVVSTYDNIIKKGGKGAEQTAQAAAQQLYKQHMSALLADPTLPKELKEKITEFQKQPFSIDKIRELNEQSDYYKARIDAKKDDLAQRKGEQEIQESKARVANDQRRMATEGKETKQVEVTNPETGEKETHFVIVDKATGKTQDTGAVAAPKAAAGGGGRATVMNNRIVASANEASESLSNLGKLSITTNGSWFSGSKHAGVLDASVNALTNKMTPEDTQVYQTVAAGLSRSLGTLETSGLQVGGHFQEQIETAMKLNPGDTNFTRITKLAEGRQIYEKAVEAASKAPGVTDEQKKLLQGGLEKVKKAIPYTTSQLLDYKNDVLDGGKKTSLTQYMKETNADGKKDDSDPLGLLGK